MYVLRSGYIVEIIDFNVEKSDIFCPAVLPAQKQRIMTIKRKLAFRLR